MTTDFRLPNLRTRAYADYYLERLKETDTNDLLKTRRAYVAELLKRGYWPESQDTLDSFERFKEYRKQMAAHEKYVQAHPWKVRGAAVACPSPNVWMP